MPEAVKREPHTKAAILVNSQGKATPHRFVRAELWEQPDGIPAVAMLYRCSETDEIRQWGLERTREDQRREELRQAMHSKLRFQ